MSFDVAADAYTRFMGRFAIPLADEFLALVDPQPGQRALDVGCGPGALTARLIDLLGADSVAAVEPSPSFVAAAQERFPDTDVRQSAAEELPFENDTFDFALAQLVVHFMTDPVAGLREMARVTREGGLVAASVWDYGSDRSPLTPFWRAAIAMDPTVVGESRLPGAREGQLPELFRAAGLTDVSDGELTVRVPFATFAEYWEPFELGVGPAGAYVGSVDAERRDELKRACAAELPDAPFVLESTAWVASARG